MADPVSEALGCSPVRTAQRVVGFKVKDQSVSPTSVLSARGVSESILCQVESPKSSLAAALREDLFKPLPRLAIRTPSRTPSGLRKSFSHADLQRSCIGLSKGHGESPATPGSRTSASSTPMKIPPVLARVRTCPIALNTMNSIAMQSGSQLSVPLAATLVSHCEVPATGSSSAAAPQNSFTSNELKSRLTDVAQAGTQLSGDDLFMQQLEADLSQHANSQNRAVSWSTHLVRTGSQGSQGSPSRGRPSLRLPKAAFHRRFSSLE